MNLNVPQKRLKQLCLRAGFGYICDIRPVTSDHAAWYVSKYLTKEWMSRQANLIRQYTRCRIVQASRDIGAIFAKVSNWEAEEIFPRKMDMLHDSKMLALDIVNRTRDQCEMDWGSFGFEIKYRPEQIVERELWISPEGVFPNAMWGAEIARAQHTIVEASMPWILHEAVIDDTEDLLFGYGNHHSPPPLKPPLHSGYGVATGPNGSHLGNAWDPDFVPELVLT
ncbi:MAG: hypothetical protein GY799_28120 [Desulfobulbaceae bacterium]|nr:hypothetical protein [Desulfobulbaceae bacterium]